MPKNESEATSMMDRLLAGDMTWVLEELQEVRAELGRRHINSRALAAEMTDLLGALVCLGLQPTYLTSARRLPALGVISRLHQEDVRLSYGKRGTLPAVRRILARMDVNAPEPILRARLTILRHVLLNWVAFTQHGFNAWRAHQARQVSRGRRMVEAHAHVWLYANTFGRRELPQFTSEDPVESALGRQIERHLANSHGLKWRLITERTARDHDW